MKQDVQFFTQREYFVAYLEGSPRARVLAIAFLSILVVAVADYLTGPELSFSIFYFVPMSFVAWFAGRRDVVAASFICAGFWLGADLLAHHEHSSPVVPVWNSSVRLGVFVTVGLTLSYLRDRVTRELEMASEVQRALSPVRSPQFHGYEFSYFARPTRHLSGDYFDFFALDSNNLGLCIADAAGHGISSALVMANLQSAVRIYATGDNPPSQICGRANTLLSNEDGTFVSFFYATIDHRLGRLRYSNAGHEPPILVRSDGSYETLGEGGLPLGIQRDASYQNADVHVGGGSRLVLYTDGVVELVNRRDEPFGFDRLLTTVLESHGSPALDIRRSIVDRMVAFGHGAFQDDVTLIVIAIP